jgi:isoaspartyl peptidase/L-asparaginase-like protein (Ntn-hydrolase superfamily)
LVPGSHERGARAYIKHIGGFLLADPVLVIHGGAWAIPDDMVEAHLNGVRNAMAAGWRVLEGGGTALDAVEEAVVIMEDDETFDAGRGGGVSSGCAIPSAPHARF